jgi:hypothetical protein
MKRTAKRINSAKLRGLEKLPANSNAGQKGFGYEMPPDEDLVQIYFDQKGLGNLAQLFYRDYQAWGWKTQTGKKIRNWKVLAVDWIFNYRQTVKLALRRSGFNSPI